MELTTDGDYMERQQALVEHILRAIKTELEKADAPTDVVQQLTGSIAFAITALLDGSASAEYDGNELDPCLAFSIGPGHLLWAGGSSWMHEYVYRTLPKLFPPA